MSDLELAIKYYSTEFSKNNYIHISSTKKIHMRTLLEQQQAEINKLQKAANLPSSYRVAKSAMKYFDSEFMGQEPKQLWSWAIEEALAELSNDS